MNDNHFEPTYVVITDDFEPSSVPNIASIIIVLAIVAFRVFNG